MNVPICTQGMQRTWWSEASTIIVTGLYLPQVDHWPSTNRISMQWITEMLYFYDIWTISRPCTCPIIRVTAHERHGVSNHWLPNCFSKHCFPNSMSKLTSNTSKLCVFGPCVRRIHGWLVDYPHKRPVMQRSFPCQDAILMWEVRVNSMWPSDTIWWHKTGSILAQVMACCLKRHVWLFEKKWLLQLDKLERPFWEYPRSNIPSKNEKLTSWMPKMSKSHDRPVCAYLMR